MSLFRREEYRRRGFRKKQVPFSIDELSTIIQNKSPDVYFAYLFGSAQNGVIPVEGDIDIAIYMNEQKQTNWDTIANVIDIIETFLQFKAECDLTILNKSNIYLRYECLRGKCLFVKDQYKDLYCNIVMKTYYEIEEANYLREKYYDHIRNLSSGL
jgi:predicted nucleotidyltransferase